MYNEEAWVVLDYFVGIYCGMAVITRATKTPLIIKNGRRFRKPGFGIQLADQRGEVYSTQFTERGWKSFSDLHKL